jgi:hypothetical protein
MTRVYKGKQVAAGAVSISITIMHASVAERFPAAIARGTPNLNPVLPPPKRFKFNLLRPDLLLLVRLPPAAALRAQPRALTQAAAAQNVLGPELFTQLLVVGLVILGGARHARACESHAPSDARAAPRSLPVRRGRAHHHRHPVKQPLRLSFG